MQNLVAEVGEASEQRRVTDLSPEAFAVLWYLRKEKIASADSVARDVDAGFAANPHWRSSAAQERELRKALYKALIDAGVEDVVELASGLLRTLRRASA